jgi:hypothetical protein
MEKRMSKGLTSLRDRKAAAAPAPAAAQPSGGRQGKKAITGYFSPEMSFAMNTTARREGMSLQAAMTQAFDDWLRKMGESPIGG